jgi:hypothetical protein
MVSYGCRPSWAFGTRGYELLLKTDTVLGGPRKRQSNCWYSAAVGALLAGESAHLPGLYGWCICRQRLTDGPGCALI